MKMSSIPSELSLDCRPVFVPRTITEFLAEISLIGSLSDRVLKIDDYVARLEDEMRKIDAFKRELPLCMLLVNDAIVALKEESVQCRKSKVEPVLEEFIPLKKSCDGGGDRVEIRKDKDSREKMNWMSSAQLWHGENHSPSSEFTNKKPRTEANLRMTTEEAENSSITNDLLVSCKTRNIGKAFMPFKRYSGFPSAVVMKEDKELPGIPGLSLGTPGFKNPREDMVIGCLNTKACVSSASSSSVHSIQTGAQPQQQQTSRKQRRCWSPELHKRFVNALQQLGGAQVATPKQIRELMQVDGLTNDEVKSHLQKYRLHTRRLPGSQATSANQSVVLGNLFMPHDQSHESSKQSSSQSGSPQDPLHHQDDSMEEEEEGDE
ncbi:PREDICTED: myb family transcription factor EFM-like isoform X1 [Ipomoea nil]|uniref:myb family transcription factor EFM-like isoform X1 n=1 Tax=Ipomoea nil TaxID=35883 RepID=UPI000900C1DD|nr:PREDICTED: myb family transcription factor EFM-like isoform X1 [Ipomoea nil]